MEPLERLSVDDFYIVKEYKSVVKLYLMTTDSCGNDHKFRLFLLVLVHSNLSIINFGNLGVLLDVYIVVGTNKVSW